MSDESEFTFLVKRLCAHLRQHRRASDTAQGIAAWWIGADRPPSPAALGAALDWLVDRGVLVTIRAGDGRTHYRCPQDIDDLDLRLDALARDPHSLLARGGDQPRMS